MNPYVCYDWESFVRHCSSSYPSEVLTSLHWNLNNKIAVWKGYFQVKPPYLLILYIRDHLNPLDTHCVNVNMSMKDLGTYTLNTKGPSSFRIKISVKGLTFYRLVIA